MLVFLKVSILILSFMIMCSTMTFAEELIQQGEDHGQETILESTETPSFEFYEFFEKIRSRLGLSGYLRHEMAVRYFDPVAPTKLLTVLSLKPRYSLGPASLNGRIRAFYDAVYDIESIDNISPRKGPEVILTEDLSPEEISSLSSENSRNVEIDKTGLEIKELYLDIYIGNLDIRLGKQIVRWGVAEGARVTDEINPLDFRELILRDVEDRYVPTTLLDLNLFIGNSTLEFIWIPGYFLEFHKPAPRESEWEQFRLLPGTREPAKTLKNSELATRFLWSALEGDFSLSYFYTWDDFPAAFRTVGSLGEFGVSPEIEFSPRYTRLHIFGGTFTKGIGGKVIINGEAAYVKDKVFGVRLGRIVDDQFLISFGEAEKNYLKYALQIDFTLFGASLSLQGLQQYIFEWEPDIIQDQIDTVASFFARKEVFHNLFAFQVLVIHFINDKETLISPRVDHRLTDRITLSLGADIFQGTIADSGPEGPLLGEFHFIGFFRNNSRIFFEVNYGF